MPRYLQHVTLTTGHTRRSWRHEISEEALAACLRLLDDFAVGARPEMPGFPAYALTGARHGRCLIATVWGEATGAPVATIGVAENARCGARLWRELHREFPGGGALATDPEAQPEAPWIGARLLIGAALHTESMHWMGDFERCLGWAWLAYLDEQPKE